MQITVLSNLTAARDKAQANADAPQSLSRDGRTDFANVFRNEGRDADAGQQQVIKEVVEPLAKNEATAPSETPESEIHPSRSAAGQDDAPLLSAEDASWDTNQATDLEETNGFEEKAALATPDRPNRAKSLSETVATAFMMPTTVPEIDPGPAEALTMPEPGGDERIAKLPPAHANWQQPENTEVLPQMRGPAADQPDAGRTNPKGSAAHYLPINDLQKARPAHANNAPVVKEPENFLVQPRLTASPPSTRTPHTVAASASEAAGLLRVQPPTSPAATTAAIQTSGPTKTDTGTQLIAAIQVTANTVGSNVEENSGAVPTQPNSHNSTVSPTATAREVMPVFTTSNPKSTGVLAHTEIAFAQAANADPRPRPIESDLKARRSQRTALPVANQPAAHSNTAQPTEPTAPASTQISVPQARKIVALSDHRDGTVSHNSQPSNGDPRQIKAPRPTVSVASTQATTQPLAVRISDPFQTLSGEAVENIAWDIRPHTTTTTQVLQARPEMPTQLAQQMAQILHRNPDRPLEIALNPAELGRVRMTLTASEAGITVNILADRADTLDLMRRNIDDLSQSFSDLGYDEIAFAFGQSGDPADMDGDGDGGDPDAVALTLESADDTSNDIPNTPRLAIVAEGVDIRL
ncbi:flagellar hook-length control protein FliK [uncultured Tateyamaria sp.]|uniref:flagellar hook-length control protein FliK n=1 Tax=uncultured Tateyamaria sp. TaxID=455651 RepID=UPI0026332559|nr:flagellar hook-length control protein FliK [uncultured Tateyamaria sp.]